MKPTVIDLFAGVGGLSLGFEMRGFNVFVANEYDKSIAAAYTANHKSTKMIVGDITSLDLDKTFGQYKGKVDVVIGGPPCQGFSQKGQRKTIHDVICTPNTGYPVLICTPNTGYPVLGVF